MATPAININPSQNQPPSTAPAQPTPDQGGSKIGGFFHGLLSAASGLPTQQQSVDPNTGQTVTSAAPQASTRDMFKGMFAGMLTGLAGGVRANQSGEHGALGAFAGGYQAQGQQLQQRDAQAKQAAQQQFKNQQSAQTAGDQHTLNKLAMVQANQDIAAKSLQSARLKVQVSDEAVDRMNKFQDSVTKVPGAEFAGFHATGADLMSDPKVQDLIKAHANGTLISTPVVGQDKDGNPIVTGIESYLVPKATLDQQTTEPTTWYGSEPGKDGSAVQVKHTLPAGSMTVRDSILLQQKEISGLITPSEKFTQSQENARATEQRKTQLDEANIRAQSELKAAEISSEKNELSPEQISKTAELVGHNDLSLNTLRYLERMKNFTDLTAAIKDKYPGWSQAQYEAGLKMREYYLSGSGSTQLRGVENAIQHLSSADQLLSKLPATSDVKALNRATVYWAKQFGNPEINSYESLINAIAPEFGKGLAGGKPDKESIETFEKQMGAAQGPTAARAVLNQMAHVLYQNLDTTAGTMQRSIPNLTNDPLAPNIGQGAEEALHHFGFNNPLNFGQLPKPLPGGSTVAPSYVVQQALKASGGDPKKAQAALMSRGWTDSK